MHAILHISRALATVFTLATASVAFAADDGDWTVHKSSGEVWIAGSGVQQASLKQEDVLKPGDTVRTLARLLAVETPFRLARIITGLAHVLRVRRKAGDDDP